MGLLPDESKFSTVTIVSGAFFFGRRGVLSDGPVSIGGRVCSAERQTQTHEQS